MEKIDRGRLPPRLGGPYGSFLRHYARERNDVISLALRHKVAIRADGAISGRPLEEITLVPVDKDGNSTTSESPWGPVARYLALCPELLTLVVVRLWLSAASGREAYQALITAPQEALEVCGDFRWLPPGTLTAGRAKFDTRRAGSLECWQNAPFLKATADDLADIPHALDYRDVQLRGRFALAHFRTFVIVVDEDGSMTVPGGVRPKSVRVPLKDDGPLAGMICKDRRLFICLCFREPGEDAWTVWLASHLESSGALIHNVRWARYVRYLHRQDVDDPGVIDACRQALAVSLVQAPEPMLDELENHEVVPEPIAQFVHAIAVRMRT
ncbi:MAG: hypothetical protein ACREIA_07760 [Opitutaceae bacterium]